MHKEIKQPLVNLAMVVISTLSVLAFMEFSLSLLNYPPKYGLISKAIAEFQGGRFAKWWIYDPELGTKFVQSEISTDIVDKLRGQWRRRLCEINMAGYHDTDEFSATVAQKAEKRILFLGDSFVFGASARKGYSFVETFEKLLHENHPKALVWNTGIPASGTEQHFLTLKKFAPIMNPHHVILGFFENDFRDNLVPVNRYTRTESGFAIEQFVYNKEKN